jgi:membrane-associated phospholipid phosphatase
MLRQLRPKWFAVTIATVLCLVPIVVGVSRLYRGMHHPTDVVFGVVCGGVWLALILTTLLPRPPRRAEPPTRRSSADIAPTLAADTVNQRPEGDWSATSV